MYPENKLTRFERARIIGARALQISMGAPILIKPPEEMVDPTEIAILEFKERKVPMTVVRRIKNKSPIIIDINKVDLEKKRY